MNNIQQNDTVVYVDNKPYMIMDNNGCYSPVNCPTFCGETVVVDWQKGNTIAKQNDIYNKNDYVEQNNKYVYVVTKINSSSSFYGYAYVDPKKDNVHIYFDTEGGWVVGNKKNNSSYPVLHFCGITL